MRSKAPELEPRPATGLVRKLAGSPERGAEARDQLLAVVYQDLRRLARGYVSRERADLSFTATDLVHETYKRLVDQTRVDWQGRSHFFAVAAQAMRRILVDRARRRRRLKRGGAWQRVTLEPESLDLQTEALDPAQVLALDQALTRLGDLDERQAKVVELRYFAGMSVPEVAAALDVSPRSVDRDWKHARSWLRRELAEAATPARPARSGATRGAAE